MAEERAEHGTSRPAVASDRVDPCISFVRLTRRADPLRRTSRAP